MSFLLISYLSVTLLNVYTSQVFEETLPSPLRSYGASLKTVCSIPGKERANDAAPSLHSDPETVTSEGGPG